MALGVRQASRQPAGVTTYESLGIYRILAGGEHNAEVEGFVREWLGPLLDYDAAHGAELVKTLSTYLECGGNYDETADGLAIHRSTLALPAPADPGGQRPRPRRRRLPVQPPRRHPGLAGPGPLTRQGR